MKLSNALLGVAAFTHGINAVAAPEVDAVALDNRASEPEFEAQSERSANEELWKRKGGGGGGGRGGGGGGGGRGSGSSSGGGRGSSSGSSRPPPNSPTSNTGGRTTTGSGPPPTYGSGYYSGGARAPYGPGTTSGGIAPALLTGAALGGLGFVGYHYLNGAYSYPYTHHSYTFYNATTMMNETKPVVCLCDRYDPCTCEDNGDQAYFKSIIGNGTYDGLNMSIVTVADDAKTRKSTIYINGGVPNGTTASGGTDDPNAASGMTALAQAAGWWPAAAVAFATAFML